MPLPTRFRRSPAQRRTTADKDPTRDGRDDGAPGVAAPADDTTGDRTDRPDAAGDQDAPGADTGNQDAPGDGAPDQDPPENDTADHDPTGDGAPDRDTARDPRRHPIAGRAATVLACLLVLFALIVPNDAGKLTPAALARIPLEGLLGIALVVVLPARWRRPVTVLAGVALGLLAILKMVDLGFSAVLARPFDLVFDWPFFGNAMEFLSASAGRLGAIGAVVAAALLAAAVLVLMALSVLRLTRIAAGRGRTAMGAAAVLGVAWITCAALGARLVPGVPVATTASGRLLQIRASLHDRQVFAAQAAVDAFRGTPGDRLLTALRGKDVVLAFVESYGRDAVEDPEYAPRVDAVLDAGTRRLRAAGFGARSAFLTSPTFGGGSWLAHGTLLSGLWIDNQQRYDKLIRSDRLTLGTAFRRAGWRTVAVEPAVTRAWPEGTAFFGYDHLNDRWTMGYRGPRFNWGMPPDQYTLSFFQRSERGPHHAPVMAEIPLVTSHAPWAPTPRLIGWNDVGDGTVFGPMAASGDQPDDVWRNVWHDPSRVRAAYRGSIEYSLNTLISYVETYGGNDLVLVFLGDHQAAPLITGNGASRDVPITIVARDRAVLDRISGWGWQDGLRPDAHAPVWRMNAFRDRFLTAFGSQPAPGRQQVAAHR